MWRRSDSDRVAAGTLAGAARSLGVSPAVTRVTAIGVAVILPLPVIVVYVVVSLLLPATTAGGCSNRQQGGTTAHSGGSRSS